MRGDRPRFQALEHGCLFRSLIQPHTVHLCQAFLLAKYVYLIPGWNPLQHQLLCPKAHLKIVSTKSQTSSSKLVWEGFSEWCILRLHPLRLWTCEARKHIICFQNTVVGQALDHRYRHSYSKQETVEGRSLFSKAVWKFSRANPLGFKTWEQCSVAWRLCSGPKTLSPESSPFSLKVSICFQLSSFVCFLPVAFGEYSILFFVLSCLLPFQFKLVWASQKPSVRLLPILEIPATAPPWSWVLQWWWWGSGAGWGRPWAQASFPGCPCGLLQSTSLTVDLLMAASSTSWRGWEFPTSSSSGSFCLTVLSNFSPSHFLMRSKEEARLIANKFT